MKVEFHSGVVDKLGSACGFLRKAGEAGAAVTVCGDEATLDRLDLALWCAEPLSFLPHLRLRPGRPIVQSLLARTPILLTDRADPSVGGAVLLNLGPELAEHWERFERVVEIISNEPDDAAAGRLRWRHYVQCAGIELMHKPRQAAS